ncbi:hypothetical protein BC827DRAFT_1375162 [Russula dissimulans]|nr:hypothetical protein BC827DRAFT_1375162 [Russula dissimulans]
MAPRSLVPPGLAGFILPLCTNVLVTILIAVRIWYLSLHKAGDLQGARLLSSSSSPFSTPLNIVGVIAVQIYGIAPALIIICVTLGLSNTPSGRFRSGVRSVSQLAPMQVRIGYNTSAFPEPGQRLARKFPMPQIKSKPSGGDPSSSFSSSEIAASV